MDAPELAALVLLEHAIDVARIAMLAQHIELTDPDPPFTRDPPPGSNLIRPFFARAHALAIVIRRYRAAVAHAAVGLDGARDEGGCLGDDDFRSAFPRLRARAPEPRLDRDERAVVVVLTFFATLLTGAEALRSWGLARRSRVGFRDRRVGPFSRAQVGPFW